MYKNYLFDLYGTILSVQTDEESDFVWEKMALYMSYYGANYEANELRVKFQKSTMKILNANNVVSVPGIDIQDVFYKLFKDKNVKPKKRMARDTAKVFRMLTTNELSLTDGIRELFEAIKENKGNIYLYANAQNAYALPELRKVELRDYFDGFFLSSDLAVCKPDKLFFDAVFSKNDLKKKESVLISADYHNDILPAMENGLDAIYIQSESNPAIEEKEGLKVICGIDMQLLKAKLLDK